MNHADEIERQLKIEKHWSAEISVHQTFIGAVECLEGLVVQRLFELSKANLAATGVYFYNIQQILSTERSLGYKLRKHISKAIAKCSSAICTALKKYNELAPSPADPSFQRRGIIQLA